VSADRYSVGSGTSVPLYWAGEPRANQKNGPARGDSGGPNRGRGIFLSAVETETGPLRCCIPRRPRVRARPATFGASRQQQPTRPRYGVSGEPGGRQFPPRLRTIGVRPTPGSPSLAFGFAFGHTASVLPLQAPAVPMAPTKRPAPIANHAAEPVSTFRATRYNPLSRLAILRTRLAACGETKTGELSPDSDAG
jgi:hypothetical protein